MTEPISRDRIKNMSKTQKVILFIATLWPVFYAVLFIVFVNSILSGPASVNSFSAIFPIILYLHIFTILVLVVLLVIYIMNIFKNYRVAKNARVSWVIRIIIFNVIAMPIYWYFYIWKEPQTTMSGTVE